MNGVQNRRIITQNLYAGEKVLKCFNSDFQNLQSNTRYNLLIENHKNDLKYSDLLPKLKGKSILAGLKMNGIRVSYNNAPNKINYLKKAVKFQKVANCQERAFLVHNELNNMGIQSQNIRLNFIPKDGQDINKNHAFTVIGMAENADPAKPKTWGENAVIVDAWANIVKRASDGLEYLKGLFKYNPEVETYELSAHRNI